MLPSGLVATLLQDLLDPDARGLDPAALSGAVDDMKARVRGMPRYLGAGMTALTLVFGASGYRRWPRAQRLAWIHGWRTSPASPTRDFIEFYEKMGTFVYWSRIEHAQASHG